MDPAVRRAPPDLANPSAILRAYGIRPTKRLGQHFLIDRAPLADILEAAGPDATDTVIEIGPGVGVLTAALADRAGRVIAVELDERMRAILADVVGWRANVTVVGADILDVDVATLAGFVEGGPGPRAGYLVVANLPYYITSAVLRHVLEAQIKPERAVLMVQREVALRILAQPGDLSILAVAVAYFAKAELVAHVPSAAFYPRPKVDSAVLRLEVHASPPVAVPSEAAFFRTVRAGFSQRRKQLPNALSGGLAITAQLAKAIVASANIEPSRRAQTLTLEEWGRLTFAMVATLGPDHRGSSAAPAGAETGGY